MKKVILTVICIVVLSTLFSQPALCVDITKEQEKVLEINRLEKSLPEEAGEILDGISASGTDPGKGLSKLYEAVESEFGGILKDALKSGITILAAAVFCAIGTVFCGEGRERNYIVLAGVLAISAAVFGNLHSFVGLGKTVLLDLNAFSHVLLPTLVSAAAGGGAVTSAAAKYAATALFMDILITVGTGVIMPLIYAYMASSAAKAAFGGEALEGVVKFIKWAITALLTVLMLAFTLYLTITGIISGTADAAAVKTAKTVISASLPVVGGIVSDAASAVVNGMSILKNSVGVFGLLSVCAVCLVPFLRLGLHYIIYKAVAALAGSIADVRISKFIDAIGTAFGMTIGLSGAAALMLFFSIISVLKAVVS